MRWVESGVQSGRYFAPMSRAFSLSSPRKGFWKPLRTNTTPSMIRLNGTCGTFSDLAFCCLGLGSGFFSADLWAGEAGDKQRLFKWKHDLKAKVRAQGWVLPFGVDGLGVLAGLGLCFGVAALASGDSALLIFLEGGGPVADWRSLLNSNFLFAGGYQERTTTFVESAFVWKQFQRLCLRASDVLYLLWGWVGRRCLFCRGRAAARLQGGCSVS